MNVSLGHGENPIEILLPAMHYPDFNIVYEDNHLIAVNKPAGILAQGDATGDRTVLDHIKHYIKVKYEKPGEVFLGLCHRLDRPVSGVLLMARTSKALHRVNRLFADGSVRKKYVAITDATVPQAGRVTHWLKKDRRRNVVSVVSSKKEGAKSATTMYRLLAVKHGLSLVVLMPHTGRPHQLRVAMQSLGAPILGDVKYGSTKKGGQLVYLHSHSLEFLHPTKREWITISAELPSGITWSKFNEFKEEITLVKDT